MPECLRPVNTIARPCSSAAAITSCVAHRAPRLHHGGGAGRRHRVEAVAERKERVRRGDRSLERVDGPAASAFIRATFTASTRLICPAPMASVRSAAGEDHGVRLHVRADAPREPQRLPFLAPSAAGCVTTRRSPRGHGRRGLDHRGRGSAPARAPRIERSSRPRSAARRRRSPRSTTRMFGLAPRIAARLVVDRRRDHRFDERRRRSRAPSSASIGRFRPTMPPNAASASASRART